MANIRMFIQIIIKLIKYSKDYLLLELALQALLRVDL